MKYLIGTLLIIFSSTLFGLRISKGIAFKQNVSGYLKRAADANTVDLAKGELKKAIDFLEENDLTSGYTSILYQTPDEDIDFWYRNLKASVAELENLNTESSLERTNVLIKLRETLLDHSGDGKEKVTVPEGLSVYPDNKLWTGLMLIAVITFCAGIFIVIQEVERATKAKAASN